MSALGDVMLGIVRPVRLDLLPDKSKPLAVDPDGPVHFAVAATDDNPCRLNWADPSPSGGLFEKMVGCLLGNEHPVVRRVVAGS